MTDLETGSHGCLTDPPTTLRETPPQSPKPRATHLTSFLPSSLCPRDASLLPPQLCTGFPLHGLTGAGGHTQLTDTLSWVN